MSRGLVLVFAATAVGATVSCARPSADETAAPSSTATADTVYDGPPKRVLVELFSSQGCNSCPAADALVGTFDELGFSRDKVVPLTFHVTYWDDLGWSDPFARALFDQRQIGYAQALPAARSDDETTIRGPYTPQMVVDGRVHFSGALAEVATEQIERARRAPTLIELQLSATPSSDGVVAVAVTSTRREGVQMDTDQAKVGLFAALAQRTVQTEVPRGENAGTKLTEHWVVRDFAGPKLFRSARAANETQFKLATPDDAGAGAEFEVVVFAQALATLQVVAVETAALPPSAG